MSRRIRTSCSIYAMELKITRSTLAFFGSGGLVYGVVRNAHYFVLVYYSQVLGLSPELAGLALGVGLIFDAISDPLVGYLSDNTKSRLCHGVVTCHCSGRLKSTCMFSRSSPFTTNRERAV